MLILIFSILFIIFIIIGLRTDWFACFHKWEYISEYGWTYQQKRCKKCDKLKIVSQ